MWLNAGGDFNRNNEIQKPSPMGTSGKRGANRSSDRAEGWGSDGTASTMARLEVGTTGALVIETARREKGYERDRHDVSVKKGQENILRRIWR